MGKIGRMSMAKRIVYAFNRYIDKTDGNIRMDYLRCEGYDVPNEYGLELAAYKGEAPVQPTGDRVPCWFVIEVETGLAVGMGINRRKAVNNALANLSKVDMNVLNAQKAKFLAEYGCPPDHRQDTNAES